MRLAAFLFLQLLISLYSYGQSSRTDSLLALLKTFREDTNKVNLLNLLISEFKTTDTTRAYSYGGQVIKLSEKLGFGKGMGDAYTRMAAVSRYWNRIEHCISSYKKAMTAYERIDHKPGMKQCYADLANLYRKQGEYAIALDFYTKLENLGKETGDRKALMEALGGYGNIHRYKGEYDVSLDYYQKAIRIAEELGDKQMMASWMNNMALIYDKQKNYGEELKLSQRVLSLFIESGDSVNMVLGLNNLAELHYKMGSHAEALDYFNRSMKVVQLLGEERVGYRYVANAYEFRGQLALDEKSYDKAITCYKKAIELMTAGSDAKGTLNAYGYLSDAYVGKRSWNEAQQFMEKKLEISKNIGYRDGELEAYLSLAKILSGKGDFSKAFSYQSSYIALNDSLTNGSNMEKIAEMQARFDSERKEKEIAIQQVELERQGNEIKQKTIVNRGVIGGCIVLAVMGGFIFRSYSQKKKAHSLLGEKYEQINRQNEQITQQKEIIEMKNRDITASIRYAKHIQEAILPPGNVVSSVLNESFVLYKPKDIVSGDFYWMQAHGGKVYFAAVDCTGHGVPGAFMSIVAHNALNSVMSLYAGLDPGKLLDKLNAKVKETFGHQHLQSSMKDGMDISLCCLDRASRLLQFAGANNPVCIVTNGDLLEIKGDKQAIVGGTQASVPFTTHEIELQKGDCIYIFSDGYADQFGGDKGKKFKYSRLKELLVSVSHKPMHEQEAVLHTAIEQWRGNLEQVDDILVLGVRV